MLIISKLCLQTHISSFLTIRLHLDAPQAIHTQHVSIDMSIFTPPPHFLPISAPEYMISVNGTQRVTLIRKRGGTVNFFCGFIPNSVNTARLSLQGDHVTHGNMGTENGEFL